MNLQAQFVWDSLEFRTRTILRIVEPLSASAMHWLPPNNSNSIAWLIWHIAEVEDNWVRDRVYGQPRRYPFGKSVRETAPDQYPSRVALLGYFSEVRSPLAAVTVGLHQAGHTVKCFSDTTIAQDFASAAIAVEVVPAGESLHTFIAR